MAYEGVTHKVLVTVVERILSVKVTKSVDFALAVMHL